MKLTVTFDGSITRNPGGTASYGYTITPDEGEIVEGRGVVGHGPDMTVNVAEYHGLLEGLKAVLDLASDDDTIHVQGDSRIVLHGVSGHYAHHKSPHLAKLRDEVLTLIDGSQRISFEWIPRERNTWADALASEALACT